MKTLQQLLQEEENKERQKLEMRKTFQEMIEEELAAAFQKAFPDKEIDSSKVKVTATKRY